MRAVFDYFVGYKLGLTATPIAALESELGALLDTYRTFGCADSQPRFRYTLLGDVREDYLIKLSVVDTHSSVTTTPKSAALGMKWLGGLPL